jgi:hypothetical protein
VGICFFCLPQAEKAEKARISKRDIFLMLVTIRGLFRVLLPWGLVFGMPSSLQQLDGLLNGLSSLDECVPYSIKPGECVVWDLWLWKVWATGLAVLHVNF